MNQVEKGSIQSIVQGYKIGVKDILIVLLKVSQNIKSNDEVKNIAHFSKW